MRSTHRPDTGSHHFGIYSQVLYSHSLMSCYRLFHNSPLVPNRLIKFVPYWRSRSSNPPSSETRVSVVVCSGRACSQWCSSLKSFREQTSASSIRAMNINCKLTSRKVSVSHIYDLVDARVLGKITIRARNKPYQHAYNIMLDVRDPNGNHIITKWALPYLLLLERHNLWVFIW